MADLVIKGGTVLTMNGPIIENGLVAVENGMITSVGKDIKEKGEKMIDATGCVIMPGLINAHTHLPMTLLRGCASGLPYREWTEKVRRVETELTAGDVRAGARVGGLGVIKSGTTP